MRNLSSKVAGRAGRADCASVEALEARQLLSAIAASTAAGFLPALTLFSRSAARFPGKKNAPPPVASPAPVSATPPPGASPAVSTPPALFPGSTYRPAGSGNYSTGRNSTNWIVIHTTESTASSTINEFQTAGLQVSANYMVERNGTIDQFVSNLDTAFHSGNSAYNHASIGIEHERYDSGGATITEQEYEASATLVRWISSYYAIPLQHFADADNIAPADPTAGSDIIGHYQVPDPSNPNLGGGANHHTDPVNWDWTHYIGLLNTTTTPLMPVLIGPGNISSSTAISNVIQTLSWMPAANATSYQITLKDITANSTATYTVAAPTASKTLTLTTGHSYSWFVTSFLNTTPGIASPTYLFNISNTAALTDAQKQSLMLGMVNTYRGAVLPEVELAEIMQEGGQGAFYVDGSTKNSFYSTTIQPWCQPTTNANGIMQVLPASGYQLHAPYANTQQGYDDSINDGSADLKANLATYGTLWQASLHYNSGANSLYTYKGINGGFQQYLAGIATKLGTVSTLYGITDIALVDKYNAAQSILNGYLNNASILTGQPASYYTPYQTQLDAALSALGPADDAPATPTNISPANGATGASITPTLSASAFSDPNAGDTQSAAQWVIRRVSDGTIVYDTGTDTTDKTSLVVPAGKLSGGTQYSWQVRYADSEGLFGAYSTATTFTSNNNAPTIASFTVSPNPIMQGYTVTATPSGVADSDGTVANVKYWAETNNTPGLQTGAGGDTLLATATGSGFVGTLGTSNLPAGQQVLYAYSTDNLGATSSVVSTTITLQPAASSVTATATSGRAVHVSWTNPAPGVSGFNLERSINGGAYSFIAQLSPSATFYDDTGLSPGTTYAYRLSAYLGLSSSTPVVSNTTATWQLGDIDGDGSVNFNDFLVMQNNLGQSGGWLQGDLDNNGIVDYRDFQILQPLMS